MTKPPEGPLAGHISAEDLAAFLAQRILPPEKKKIIAHLEQCPLCRALAVELMLSEAAVPDPDDDSD